MTDRHNGQWLGFLEAQKVGGGWLMSTKAMCMCTDVAKLAWFTPKCCQISMVHSKICHNLYDEVCEKEIFFL